MSIPRRIRAGRPAAQAKSNADSPRRWMESEDAMDLWYEYQRSGDQQLRDRLVLTYAPLVKFIVYRKIGELPASCEVDDLVSAGLEALIKSLDRYDPGKGATLEQFAWTRIHGAVIDELRRGDWAPRSLRRWERDMRRVQSECRSIHGRSPSDAELADALNMTAHELVARKRDLISSDVTSLNTLVLAHDGASVERIDVLPSDDDSTDPLHEAAKTQAKEHFRRAFAALGRREREVAVLLYVNNLTLREVGEVLGVSESRVCQIHGELKKTLKRALANDAELLREVA
ncbi:MAG TPA: FliA/WhiG family RNA polymerase sigma factor [Solirubrobacteraceae bacterium]|nr:FliA/WhiG family RNA polymerase sigma factor [Solirubrobacteraceae bacterium]